jgi:phosphoesterase RecJ-like protein
MDLNYTTFRTNFEDDLKGVQTMFAHPGTSVILTHRNPDGDAIGSSVALYHLLKRLGHNAYIVLPSEFPVVFQRFFEGVQYKVYDLHPIEVKNLILTADQFFILDFNALDRIDKVGEIIHQLSNPKIAMIDHHLDPEPFATYVISETSVSSTCELLFDVLLAIDQSKAIDPIIAELLLLGIITDTGCFAYSVSPALFRKSALLMERGIDLKSLVDEIFNSLEVKYMTLLGHCLANRMEIIEETNTGLIYLNKKDFIDFNIQRGDTEGIVNYLLKLKKVQIAVLITEQPNIIKFSFRSKGDLSVSDFARKYFKGGGHKNASGGSMHGTMDAAINRFKTAINEMFGHLQY